LSGCERFKTSDARPAQPFDFSQIRFYEEYETIALQLLMSILGEADAPEGTCIPVPFEALGAPTIGFSCGEKCSDKRPVVSRYEPANQAPCEVADAISRQQLDVPSEYLPVALLTRIQTHKTRRNRD